MENALNAEKLNGKTLKMTAKTGNNGRLFGAVTSKEIAQLIKKEFSLDIEKRKITAPELKELGRYSIEVKLHTGVSAQMTVMVTEA